jgi:di- and tripeptidase
MRRWREASLTIHRFQTSGPDNSTIIPRLAKAALSIRLVPTQEASSVAAALQSFLAAEFDDLDSKNRLSVTIDHKAEPWLGDTTNEIFQTLSSAITDVWGPTLATRRASSSATNTLTHQTSPMSPIKASPATSNTLASGSDLESPSSRPQSSHPVDGGPVSPANAVKPLFIREGGSIPSIRFLEKQFNAPAAHLPCGQASDSAHLDNERLRLVNLYNSKKIFKRVFWELPRK